MDADGHFTWRAGKYQCPDIGVTNTSGALMAALTESFGGSVGRERRACPDDCTADHIHRRQDILRWHLTGYRAVLMCEALTPLLVVKAGRASEVAARYHETLQTMQRPERRRLHMLREQETWGWD